LQQTINSRGHIFWVPRYWPTWLGLACLRLLSLLPLPLLWWLASGLGRVLYWLIVPRRRVVLRNLATCFPSWSQNRHQQIAKQHFHYAAYMLLIEGYVWWAKPQQLQKIGQFRNRQYYDQALDEGLNIILLAPHFLGLEIGGLLLVLERPISTMYQYSKNHLLDTVVRHGRSRFAGQLIERKAPLNILIRSLRSGKPFYYLPDQDAGHRKGVFAPFFGTTAATYPLLGKFARLGKATVIPCYTRLLAKGKGFEVVFLPPLQDYPSGDELADTTTMNKVIEEMAEEEPEQYFWLHKRFKTRPRGEPKFYD